MSEGPQGLVIVGAGPAGLALAAGLAAAGAVVTLLEADPASARQFRGEGLMPSGLEALDALGLWPLPASVPQRALRGWAFWLQGQRLFEQPEPMGSVRPCTLILQEALLEALRSAAARHPGFRLRSEGRVQDLTWQGERVSGVVLAGGERIAADLVVACDGRGSLLRRRAGLTLREAPAPLDVLWFRLAASASTELRHWLADRFVTVLGDGGSYALFTTATGAVQLGWMLEPGSGPAPAPPAGWPELWAAQAPPELAALLRHLPAEALEGPRQLPVRVGMAERWQRPGLLLLGDAAHPMSPLRAQGINMALRDALVAAPLLAAARGPAALDAAASRIETLRRPELERIQALQQEEAGRATLLSHRPALRRLLAATAPWCGPLLQRRWRAGQATLRHGLALPGPLPG